MTFGLSFRKRRMFSFTLSTYSAAAMRRDTELICKIAFRKALTIDRWPVQ